MRRQMYVKVMAMLIGAAIDGDYVVHICRGFMMMLYAVIMMAMFSGMIVNVCHQQMIRALPHREKHRQHAISQQQQRQQYVQMWSFQKYAH